MAGLNNVPMAYIKNRSPMWKSSENIWHDGHWRSFCILPENIYEILQKVSFIVIEKAANSNLQISPFLNHTLQLLTFLNCRCQFQVQYLSNKLYTAALWSEHKLRKFREK